MAIFTSKTNVSTISTMFDNALSVFKTAATQLTSVIQSSGELRAAKLDEIAKLNQECEELVQNETKASEILNKINDLLGINVE